MNSKKALAAFDSAAAEEARHGEWQESVGDACLVAWWMAEQLGCNLEQNIPFQQWSLKATQAEIIAEGRAILVRHLRRERIESVRRDADLAFWAVVAEQYPDARGGDFPPEACFDIDDAMRTAIDRWVTWNVDPAEGE
jgi:hypothetical protein